MGKYVVRSGGGRDTFDYISEGLIKILALEDIGFNNYILINNIKDIKDLDKYLINDDFMLVEEMTIECCCLYKDFTNSEKKGRLFSCGTNALIGLSMYNDKLEAAMGNTWVTNGETGIQILPNEFVTLAMTSNKDGTYFYKNAEKYNLATDNIALKAGKSISSIGINTDYERTDRKLNSEVYMLRFYNRILSQEELLSNLENDVLNFKLKEPIL